MNGVDRRSAISLGLGAGAAAISGPAFAQDRPAKPAFTPKDLPFDSKAIPGLSEKLLVSHHDNNYVGAVKRLGAIRTEFAALDPGKAPVFTLNGLKREELIAWNSMILHELYFAGFGQRSAPPTPLAREIERSFGSFDRWSTEFASMGKALGAAPGGYC